MIAILAVLAWRTDSDELGLAVGRWWALTFCACVITLGLLILQATGSKTGYGFLSSLVGEDHRFSTSLTQVGLWTFAIATGFAYLLGRVLFDGAPFETVMPGARWDEYLILLGGPFAAAVLAKGIVTYKLQDGTLQKPEPTATEPSQVVTDDSGSPDLIDSQYLLFNLIAMGYYVVQLASTSRLPEIPSPLLALTSGTAAAYVANKAALRNAPTITSISPVSARAGDVITVHGTNFDPADPTDSQRRITVALSGFSETVYTDQSTNTMVRFSVPPGTAAGDQSVQVTSTAGVQTEKHWVKIEG